MNLASTVILNAVAVAVRLLSMLLLNKILAIFIGPAGYALVGQLQNFLVICTSLATCGVSTGVTKYTAEYTGDFEKQIMVWRTAARAGMLGAIIIALGLVIFGHYLSERIFSDQSYYPLFVLAALALVTYVFNALLLAILNGLKEIKLFVLASIGGSLLSLAITGSLAWLYGLTGALVALVVNQSFGVLITLWLCRKVGWATIGLFWTGFDKRIFFLLCNFSVMALATSVIGPIAQMLVRNLLLQSFGADAAGQWEALNRISNLYLTFLTVPLSVYYLPKLAELIDLKDVKAEVVRGFCLLIPAAMLMSVAVYLLRDFVILVLFTRDFGAMQELFGWQMVGDVMRVGAWLLSFVLLSKAKTLQFVVIEFFCSVLFVVLVYFLINFFGMVGAVKAYAINYLVYFLCLFFVVWRMLNSPNDNVKVAG